MRRILLIALTLLLPRMSPADALENAYFICDIFERTGVSSECQVSNVTSEVDAIIEGSAAEAGQVCSVIVNKMVEQKRAFRGRWKLRIFAPGRADTPLAVCALR